MRAQFSKIKIKNIPSLYIQNIKQNNIYKLLIQINNRQFSPPPEGEDRNDYQHPSFKPFGYDKHGEDWDNQKWPLVKNGQEQSPINLIRHLEPNQVLDGKFERVIFNDEEYKHRYIVNNH